jgi:alkaline phosphatase D
MFMKGSAIMRLGSFGLLLATVLGGCATASGPLPAAPIADSAIPGSAIEALRPYYLRPGLSLPVARSIRPLPARDQLITRIALGSCREETRPAPILNTILARRPDLFVALGDNVYGDMTLGNLELPELQQAYADLAAQPDFQTLAAAVPHLATWDDHDFGLNDAGGDFGGKLYAERLHETFWGPAAGDASTRAGVHHSHTFGPAGQRVQIILLDTRFDRSRLTATDQRDAPGRERYIPSQDQAQQMLDEAQWRWLADELAEPADLRILVSSIQVLADGHGWEAWRLMPREQARLYRTIAESRAKGVVLVSGDRHMSAIYRQSGLTGYPLYELTSSSLNLSFRDEHAEMSSNQLGAAFSRENFGEIAIDWQARSLALRIIDGAGATAREQVVRFGEIGL